MNQQEIDEMYMRRCLQLARNGMQNAKPNPMVGAVIVVPNPSPREGLGVDPNTILFGFFPHHSRTFS